MCYHLGKMLDDDARQLNPLGRAGIFFSYATLTDAAFHSKQIEIYQHLLRLSADDQGIEALGRALAQLSQRGVLIQDKRLQPLAQVLNPEIENWSEMLLGRCSSLQSAAGIN